MEEACRCVYPDKCFCPKPARTARDWLGNEILVGSPVLYAISEGHFAKVVWGEVLEVIEVKNPESYFGGFRWFKLKVQPRFENVDVIDPDATYVSARGTESYWVNAAGEECEWDFGGVGDVRLMKRLTPPKPAFVKNVEKVTVFPLAQDVRDRLEAVIQSQVDKFNAREKK